MLLKIWGVIKAMEKQTKLLFMLFLFYCISLRSSFFAVMVEAQINKTIDIKVGLVVDYESWVGKMGLECIKMAISDFNNNNSHIVADNNTRLKIVLRHRNSNSDVVGAAAAALDLIKNEEVQVIIGPTTNIQANFLIDIGNKAQVPIISYSASQIPYLHTPISYFFQARQNDIIQVKAIRSLVDNFGWKQVVPIHSTNSYGEGLMPFLIDALQEIDVQIPYQSFISSSTTDDQLVKELYKINTMQSRFFIVHMDTRLGSRLFQKAKEIGMMKQGYVWIITTDMTDLLSFIDSSIITNSMQGVLGIKTYIPETKPLKFFKNRWKWKSQRQGSVADELSLNIYGLWAYDAAKAISMAIQEVITVNGNLGFKKKTFVENSIDLETFGVSKNGPKLHEALSKVTFDGLAGNFSLIDGKLKSSSFQIINIVNGNMEREIGIWTHQSGLHADLGKIVWPGKEIGAQRNHLRIGVPIHGFNELITVIYNNRTNQTKHTSGYCIDVFKTAIKSLPYRVTYDLIPYIMPNDRTYYDDMVFQVYLEKFDAVVGDVTIRANRLRYVDFTMPYTESSLSMIVPVEDKRSNAWVFLKPLSWDLWVTIVCFLVFIAFVVWVLEHRINEEFRGPPAYQIGTSFWFSFLAIVAANKEKVVGNLTKIVVMIWIFVMLILTQSYTASLASLLTVQQLQPKITSVSQLLENGDNIGCLEGSFVCKVLKNLGFHDSKIIFYKSPKDCHDAFSKPKSHGGIADAFDEIPYIKIFLSKYCSNYTMVNTTYQTAGFGFVFPIGSPLVRDVSKAILDMTEGEDLNNITDKWFGKQMVCPNPNDNQFSSNSLGLDSFWILFLILGVVSISSLFICAVVFLYEQRNTIISSDPQVSIWARIRLTLRNFDQKDWNSHTFKKDIRPIDNHEGREDGIDQFDQQNTTTPSQYPSPSSYSNHTNSNLAFLGEQELSPPINYGNISQTTYANDLTFLNQDITISDSETTNENN